MKLLLPGFVFPHLFVTMVASRILADEEFTYQEISTLNMNLEPARQHFERGDGYLYGASRDKMGGTGGMIYRLAPGQPVEVLHEFVKAPNVPSFNDNGAGACGIQAVGPDGAFYGITATGGPEGYGVMFRYSIDGVLSIIDYPKADGMPFPSSMVVTPEGDIYGCSTDSGVHGGGCLFRRAADGSYTLLYSFYTPDQAGHTSYYTTAPGTVFDPFFPRKLCRGTDGRIYGITTNGGTVNLEREGPPPRLPQEPPMRTYGTFFCFDPGTGTLTVLADLAGFRDTPRDMIPAEGGFHVLLAQHLLHISYDGTVQVEVDVKAPPIAQTSADFRGPIVQTADGIFLEATYGGGNQSGYVVRFVPGGGASIVYTYPWEVSGQQRVITAGSDGKVYGLTGYPEGYTPPAASAMAAASLTERSAAPKLAAARKAAVPAPKTFRFRKPGDSTNFPPLAKSDTAWLPAKANQTGSRELIIDVLANDKDPDKQPLTISSVTATGNASATLVQTSRGPRLKVVTTEASPASQTVNYELSDGNGGSSMGSVAVMSPITASFSGPIQPKVTGPPAGTLDVKISSRNAITATFSLAGKKFTGRGALNVDDTADLMLKLRGQGQIPLRLDLIRGARPKLNAYLPAGGTTYSGSL